MRLVCLMLAGVGFMGPLASCGGEDCCKNPQDAATDAGDPYVEVVRAPVTVNRDLDLLFVIDDSPSMLDKQANLKNSFQAFIDALSGLEGGLPNVHIGVVSTDLGTKGANDAQAGPGIGSGPGSCSGNGKSGNLQTNFTTLVSGTFINDIKNNDGTRTTNYTGSLANAFSAIASLGASGCGFEQPLEAAKRALNNNPANAGFLRPNAGLALIMVSDEDDCSFAHSSLLGNDTATLGPLQSFRCTRFGVTCDKGGTTSDQMNMVGPKSTCHSDESSSYLASVDAYVQFFRGIKVNPDNVMVSMLVGPSTPVEVELRTPPEGGTAIPALVHSCQYNGANGAEVADPGVRLTQFAKQFTRNTVAGLCAQDLSVPLVDVALQLRKLAGDSCLSRPIATPYDCMVREEEPVTMRQTMLPACNNGASSTNKPCWEFVTDNAQCTAPPNSKLLVQRASAPSPSAVVIARCRV